MTNNYEKTKEWLGLAFKNIERVIRNYTINDYSECVFKIQLSVEQLQKALILLLGFKFRKIHNPSIILESIETDGNIKIEKKILENIKKVAALAKEIEGEGISTQYGIIKEGKLITPEEKYDKSEAIKYLKDLKEILINVKALIKGLPNLKQEIIFLSKFINECIDLIENDPS